MGQIQTLELWEYHVVQLIYIQTIALFISLCDLEKERRQHEVRQTMVCI